MRTYEKTHPWLDFRLDVRQLDYTSWLLLGEAVSKTEHIAGVPLDPDSAKELHALYLAKGALATTAIEGNTLTEHEVIEHLRGRLKLPPSREYLTQEIDNIVAACNDISNTIIQKNSDPITPDEIRKYNQLVLQQLPLQEDVTPGVMRLHSVMAGRYRGAPAEDCEFLLERFCDWLNKLNPPKGQEAAYSILASIAAHLYFVWIHPFGDGNGRTARLIEFRFLLQAGLPTPASHLLSNFYNLTRTEYYRQLDKASRSIILLIAARLVVKRHRWAVMAVIFCVGIFTGALRSGYIEHCGTLVDIMPQDKDSLYLIMRAKLLSPLEYRDFGMCHVPCRVEALTTLDGQPLKLTSKYRIELQIQRMSDLNWNTREMVHLHGTVITCQVRFRNKRIPKNPGAMDRSLSKRSRVRKFTTASSRVSLSVKRSCSA